MEHIQDTHTFRQDELFGPSPSHYPNPAGWKAPTSKPAALKIEPHAKTLRGRALAEFRFCHPRGLTADQLANNLGASILSVQPRVSELRTQGLIEATPDRRPNDSGITAVVWRASFASNGSCALKFLIT